MKHITNATLKKSVYLGFQFQSIWIQDGKAKKGMVAETDERSHLDLVAGGSQAMGQIFCKPHIFCKHSSSNKATPPNPSSTVSPIEVYVINHFPIEEILNQTTTVTKNEL